MPLNFHSNNLKCSLLVRRDAEVFRTFFHKSQFHYRQVMLLLVDLKTAVSGKDARESRSTQSMLQENTEYFHQTIPKRGEIGQKAWGMLGFALAELMDVVETTHKQETAEKIVHLMKEWCDIALKTRTPIEMAALCSILVRLQAFDELNEMPQEHHLMCGYYLARIGCQQLAPQFILSGIHYCAQEMPGAPIWRYYSELWTVAMNRGHWDEAESWLWSACEGLWKRDYTLPGGGLDMWKYSGELEEFTLTVTYLISDCYAARGLFLEAESMLTIAIGNTFPSQNNSVKITRIALWSRLLNVQMELRNLKRASIIAFTLCCELQALGSSVLGSQTACWAIQEILVCTNDLVREDMHSAAYHILYLFGRPVPSPDGNHRAFVDCLPDDLVALIHHRWDDVKSEFDPGDTIDKLHHRVLDILEPIGCLAGSLDNFHAVVDLLAEFRDNPPTSFELFGTMDSLPYEIGSYLQLRKDVASGEEVKGLSAKSLLLHRAAPAVKYNSPVKAVNSPSILQVAQHLVRDHPYTFPDPIVRAEGMSLHISEIAAAKCFSLPDLTSVKRYQRILKIRKIRKALNLRRHYKNVSTLLKLPKPPESFHHSLTQLERDELPYGVELPPHMEGSDTPLFLAEMGSSPISAVELPTHESDPTRPSNTDKKIPALA